MAKSSHITNDQEKIFKSKHATHCEDAYYPPKNVMCISVAMEVKKTFVLIKKIVMATAPPYQRFYLNEYKCKWERDVDISTLTWSVF